MKIRKDLNRFNSVCGEIPDLAGCIRENGDYVGKMIFQVMRRDDLEWLGHSVMKCLWLMRSSQPKQKFGTRIGFSASEFTEFCP